MTCGVLAGGRAHQCKQAWGPSRVTMAGGIPMAILLQTQAGLPRPHSGFPAQGLAQHASGDSRRQVQEDVGREQGQRAEGVEG